MKHIGHLNKVIPKVIEQGGDTKITQHILLCFNYTLIIQLYFILVYYTLIILRYMLHNTFILYS